MCDARDRATADSLEAATIIEVIFEKTPF